MTKQDLYSLQVPISVTRPDDRINNVNPLPNYGANVALSDIVQSYLTGPLGDGAIRSSKIVSASGTMAISGAYTLTTSPANITGSTSGTLTFNTLPGKKYLVKLFLTYTTGAASSFTLTPAYSGTATDVSYTVSMVASTTQSKTTTVLNATTATASASIAAGTYPVSADFYISNNDASASTFTLQGSVSSVTGGPTVSSGSFILIQEIY